MGIPERKERDKNRIREDIVGAALGILTTEGYAALSVRKIASRIEYSTGVIYHYFSDKEDIIRAVAEDGFMRILARMQDTPFDPEKPIEGFKKFYLRYFDLMLENPSWSKLALLADIDSILEKTSVLDRGISKKSATFEIMTGRLASAMKAGKVRQADPELTAQIIWTTAYGLIARLILEKNIDKKQRDRLVKEFFSLLDSYLKP